MVYLLHPHEVGQTTKNIVNCYKSVEKAIIRLKIVFKAIFQVFYHAESEFHIHFSGFSTVGLQNPHEVGQNTKNRTDFRFTVEGVVMGVKIPLKAIYHLFSTLNLNFESYLKLFHKSKAFVCF